MSKHRTSTTSTRIHRTSTGLFDGENIVTLLEGAPTNTTLSKLIITNTDTVAITPTINQHNLNRIGDDDEYIKLAPTSELPVNHRLVLNLDIQFSISQNLEIELAAEPTTNQPQWIMVF